MRSTFLSIITLLSSLSVAQVSVLTQHNDNSRTGQNLNETYLNTSTVNVSNFGKIFARTVDGYVYAQPLYVSNLTFPNGQGTHNVVYVATENNSVYAFDADDPNASTPLWHVDQSVLGAPVPSQDICQVNATDGCNGQFWPDLTPTIGITSTPVIDPATNTIYVVPKSKDTSTEPTPKCSDGTINCHYHFVLHALDLLTGAEKAASPVEITIPASAPVKFQPLSQLQRPGLLLLKGGALGQDGAVFAAFGSAGDFLEWHGWVVEYDAATLQQTDYFVSTPAGTQPFDSGGEMGGGGIFSAGQGLVGDSDNNLYFMTGNGPFDVQNGGKDYGDSAIKLSAPSINTAADYFSPYNTYGGVNSNTLGATNGDLGAGGLLMIPGTTLLVGGGKDGMLRLMDSTNMGKFNPNTDQDVQEFEVLSNPATQWIMGSPVYWNSPVLGPVVYLWPSGNTLKAWSFNGSSFNTTAVSHGNTTSPCCEGDTSPMSLSANGNQTGSGIIWAPTSNSGDPSFGPGPGILHAYDASNLSNELWNSEMNSSRDSVTNFAKFNPPTIANGKVYLATFNSPGQLLVYGLTGPYFSLGASPSSGTVTAGNPATYTVSVSGANGFSSTVDLSCGSGLPSGASCSFNPASVTPGASPATSTLTLNTASGTAANTYDVAVTGTAASVSHNTSVALVVSAPSVNFSLSATSPVSVSAGASTTSTVSVTAANGFSGAVTLTCTVSGTGTPAPTCPQVSPTSISPSQTATLTVQTSASTPAGAYTVTVTGTAGSLSHQSTVAVTVTPPATFSLSTPSPGSATVQAGAATTFTSTVSGSNGFVGTVSFTCSIATSATPAPTCAASPNSVSLSSSSTTGSVTMKLSTTAPQAALRSLRAIYFALLFPIAGVTLLGSGVQRNRTKKIMGLLLLGVLILSLLFLGACGGGSSSPGGGGGGTRGTPAGSYIVTLTGVSGSSSSQPVTFTLNVQ